MTLRLYRIKKEFIYENSNLRDRNLYMKALNLGYCFVKSGESYYSVHIKQFKKKDDEIIVEMVDLEIVEDIKEGEK